MELGSYNRRIFCLLFILSILQFCVHVFFRSFEKEVQTKVTETSPVEANSSSIMKANPGIDPNVEVRISYFKETAKSFTPITDKIGGAPRDKHRYHNMYGMFLLPLAGSKPNLKFLEIGLGCNMRYGAGASVKIWKKLFPQAELWEAEYDEKCVNVAKEKGLLDGFNILVGDQADFSVLDSWVEKSGGKFDAIIDDGGHGNCMISNTFDKLWPELNPGGYYFIEDMHVGLWRDDRKICGVMADKVGDWQKQLIFDTTKHMLKLKITYSLPKDMIFIHCQAEACVFKKRHSDINDPDPFVSK